MPPIALIALTASVLPEDRDLALEAGMDALLAKPLDADELLRMLARHLPATRRTATIPAPADAAG
jgi:CheY-like chemotaxis protein